jgi:hypothetical protein
MLCRVLSQIELNRAKKPRSFRRLNRRKLKYPAWAKLRCLMRRIFWPKPGIFFRRGSLWLWVTIRKKAPVVLAPRCAAPLCQWGPKPGWVEDFKLGAAGLWLGEIWLSPTSKPDYPEPQASPWSASRAPGLGPIRLQGGSQASFTPLRLRLSLRPARDTPNLKCTLKETPPLYRPI